MIKDISKIDTGTRVTVTKSIPSHPIGTELTVYDTMVGSNDATKIHRSLVVRNPEWFSLTDEVIDLKSGESWYIRYSCEAERIALTFWLEGSLSIKLPACDEVEGSGTLSKTDRGFRWYGDNFYSIPLNCRFVDVKFVTTSTVSSVNLPLNHKNQKIQLLKERIRVMESEIAQLEKKDNEKEL